jgi:hypothetical protein
VSPVVVALDRDEEGGEVAVADDLGRGSSKKWLFSPIRGCLEGLM